MKLLRLCFLLLAAFLFISKILFAQDDKWRLISSAVKMEYKISDVCFGATGALYACGEFGIAKSVNRDTIWTVMPNKAGFISFSRIAVSSTGSIFIKPGSADCIIKSDDEGKNWDTVFKSKNLGALCFDKTGRLWTGSFYGELNYSDNSGADWNLISRNFGSWIREVRFNNKNDILVVSYNALFLKEAADTNWSKIYEGYLNTAAFVGNDTIFVSSSASKLSVSADKGKNWSEIVADYNCPSLASDSRGNLWGAEGVKGELGVSVSSDMGKTWKYTGCSHENGKLITYGKEVFFACQKGIFVYDESIVPFRGKNYFPLAIGNKWQRYNLTNYPLFKTHIEIDTLSVEADTIVNGYKYFLLKGYSFLNKDPKWLRYDSTENILYALYNDSDKVILNYNLFNHEVFSSFNFNRKIALDVDFHSGKKTVFNKEQNYAGFYYSMLPAYSGGHEELYYGGIGFGSIDLEYKPHGLPEVFSYYRIICAIVNEGDSTKVFRKQFAPIISYKPIDTLKNYEFTINVAVDHEFSYRNPAYPEVDNTFIDSVYLSGYFQKFDFQIPIERVAGEYVDSSVNFRVKYKLYETVLKNGYKFYYKITAKDKGLIPYYTSVPDTGYFCVDKNNVVNVKNDKLSEQYEFGLAQNYPNPFNPVTTIKYSVKRESLVELSLFNVLGQKIKNFFYGMKKPGEYEIVCDLNNLSSGIYFYRLNAGGYSETRKLILQK